VSKFSIFNIHFPIFFSYFRQAMKKVITLSVIIAVIWSCSSENGNKSLTSGSKIYALYCTQCHGNTGALQLNGASNFLTSKLTLEERIDVIRDGRKTMLPYKDQLSAAQIKAVAEYTMKFSNESN